MSMEGQKALGFHKNILICVLKMNGFYGVWNEVSTIITEFSFLSELYLQGE